MNPTAELSACYNAYSDVRLYLITIISSFSIAEKKESRSGENVLLCCCYTERDDNKSLVLFFLSLFLEISMRIHISVKVSTVYNRDDKAPSKHVRAVIRPIIFEMRFFCNNNNNNTKFGINVIYIQLCLYSYVYTKFHIHHLSTRRYSEIKREDFEQEKDDVD